MKRQRPLVDTQSYALAEHFLSDYPAATEDDVWELAGEIQRAWEEFCMKFEPDTEQQRFECETGGEK